MLDLQDFWFQHRDGVKGTIQSSRAPREPRGSEVLLSRDTAGSDSIVISAGRRKGRQAADISGLKSISNTKTHKSLRTSVDSVKAQAMPTARSKEDLCCSRGASPPERLEKEGSRPSVGWLCGVTATWRQL